MPYDYQAPIIKKMVDQVLVGKNGLVIQPTATGKSVEAAFTARALAMLHSKRGLYLYDENEGLAQARLKFEEIFNGNPITCANFFGYGKDEEVKKADMVFASFQSFNNHHQKSYLKFEADHFDYMIVNEGHHAQAPTYKEVIDYFCCPKIGMTATPKRMDEKDIMEIFDEVIFEMLLDEAIAKGYVAQIEYHMLSHNLSTKRLGEICHDVLEEGKRISIKQLNESIFIEMLDEEMLKEVYTYAFPTELKPRQTLLFCENIVHAEHVLSLLQKDGCLVDVVHSKRSPGHNRNAMKHFRANKLQFLISVDKLNEDIDVPNVEVGVFLRSTDSENIFWQQLGRLLRKGRTKTKAIVLDFVANCERLMIVQDLVERIEKVVEVEGLPFQKGALHVSGEGFDFSFSKQMIDVVKLIQRLREGIYQTWQEASEQIKNIGFTSGKDYMARYKKYDLRLPAQPYSFYSDFPGWPEYLSLKKDENWVSLTEFEKLVCSESEGRLVLKAYIDRYKDKHPDHFQKLFNKKSRKLLDSYSPTLIRLVMLHIKKRNEFLSQGYKTAGDLDREKIADDKTIQTTANSLRNKFPHSFIQIWKYGKFIEHYGADLIEAIKQNIKNREVASDWVVLNKLSKEGLGSQVTLQRYVETISLRHPNAIKKIEGGHVHRRTFISLSFARLIRYKFSQKPFPKEGWFDVQSMVNLKIAQRAVILEFVKDHRIKNPQWFDYPWVLNRYIEHYHPDLVQIIKNYFKNLYLDPPDGWRTKSQIAKEIYSGNSSGDRNRMIVTFAESFRLNHLEWFGFFWAKKRIREHYHPDLVKLIKVHFAKK